MTSETDGQTCSLCLRDLSPLERVFPVKVTGEKNAVYCVDCASAHGLREARDLLGKPRAERSEPWPQPESPL